MIITSGTLLSGSSHAVGRSVTSFTSQPLFSPLSSLPSQATFPTSLLPSCPLLLLGSLLLEFFCMFSYLPAPSLLPTPILETPESILTYPVPCKHSCHVHCQHLARITHLDKWCKNHSSEPLNRLRSLSAGSMTDLFVTSPVPVTHSCLLIRMLLMKSGQINLFIEKNPTINR